MSATPVFVTGSATATCWGLGAQALWDRLAHQSDPANSASPPAMRRFPTTTPPQGSRRRLPDGDRLTAYLLAALDHDLGAFLSELSDQERERTGVALGSAYGHLTKYLAYFETGTEQGYQLVNPRLFPSTLPNWSTVSVSDAYSLWGSNTPVATGLSAGLEAIAYAAGAIRDGEDQAMIAGGCDEINPYNARVVETVTTASPGEGVGVLLLQSGDAATASKRKPLAAYGATLIRHGVWWNAPDAAARAAEAVRMAVAESGLELTEIGAVFPSANGSADADIEAQLLQDVFGTRLSALDIVPIKAVTGECFGASGPLQCVAAVEYLAHQAPAKQLDDMPGVLISGLGYDGTFAATVLSRSPA